MFMEMYYLKARRKKWDFALLPDQRYTDKERRDLPLMNICTGQDEKEPIDRKIFIATLLLKREVSPETVQELTKLSKLEMHDLLQKQNTSTQ
ncbi:hypothetical protein CEF21_18240 [Bacillus sp. FJAT-42376]|uniref:hypothetical protein n=1 Tax=Bacillus sp. FJAT-42376 TaxID=2014076 RepID=UPI000F4D61D7|nr:hypothetical protein [Bacillus sp. FJAT-42376]AZB44099.1 hypothetical protein CEF21_18240 [Bacillus sp. FJAT-42376]